MNFFQAPGLYSAPTGAAPSDLMGIYALCATSTQFLANVVYGNKATGTQTDVFAVISSPDGVNWTKTGYKFGTNYNVARFTYVSGINAIIGVDRSGYVFKSLDAGVTWTLLSGSSALVALFNTAWTNNPNGSESIGARGAVVSADGNVIMLPGVSTSYTIYGPSSRGSLYKSTDGGATWTNLVYAAAYLNGVPSAVDTDNAGMWVTVGSYGGNWAALSYGEYVYTQWNYVTYSTNNGATWTPVSTEVGMSNDPSQGYYDVKYANNMWMTCGKGRTAYSLDGITWTKVTAGLPSTVSFHSIAYGNGKWLIISPDANVAYTSVDGTSWTAAGTPFASLTAVASTIAYTNSVFTATNYDYVFGTMT